MNIEEVRTYALTLNNNVTEELFAENWIVYRVCKKCFLLMQLDAPEPRIAVKLPPEQAEQYRSEMNGVKPAYHMNKKHWNDLYLNQLDTEFVQLCIKASFDLIVLKLPKKDRLLLNL